MRDAIVMVFGVLFFLFAPPAAVGQLTVHPYIETFDAHDTVPAGWEIAGVEISSSAPRSSPNCILARGNMEIRSILTEHVDPSELSFIELRWWERRSGSAIRYRLTVFYLTPDASTLLATFDSLEAENAYRERRISLDRPDISGPGRFEFRIHPDSLNSTGVLRIDDVHLIVETRFDVGLRAAPPPQSPAFIREEVQLTFTLLNGRDEPAAGVVLDIEGVRNGMPAENTHHRVHVPPIPAHDSVSVPYAFISNEAGAFDVLGTIRWTPDQDAFNDTASVPINVGYPPGAVVITEFMFAPVREDEPEWVEIFNPGPSVVSGLHLFMSDKGAQQVPFLSSDIQIVPGEYVLLAGTSALGDLYDLTHVHWSATRLPSLNNSSADAIVIRDLYGTTLDSVWYEPAWGEPGRSLERRDWTLPSSDRATWLPSADTMGGTPGRVNSVQRYSIDGAVLEFQTIYQADRRSVLFTVVVSNTGRTMMPAGTLSFVHAAARDTSIASLSVAAIEPDIRYTIAHEWTPPFPGRHDIAAVLRVTGDLNPSNDSSWSAVVTPYARSSLLVNEIMFDPSPGECEWIEVLNTSDHPITLQDWTLSDLPTASGHRTSIRLDDPVVLQPHQLGVIAGDSSLFGKYPWLRDEQYRPRVLLLHRSGGLGLNADMDGIVLTDPAGMMVDSVTYDEDWHNQAVDTEGRSLERIRTDRAGTERETWTSAPGPLRASPGRPNLSLPPERQIQTRFSIEPNPFSPDGDGFEDLAYIRYSYPAATVFVRARIFDDTGREVRSLSNGALTSGKDLIMWNGLDDAGRRVRFGPYIIFVEAWNGENAYSTTEKHVIVVAR